MPAVLERYSSERMRILWGEEKKFRTWLLVELAALLTRGDIDTAQFKNLVATLPISMERIAELEREFDHDTNAFIEHVRKQLEQLLGPRLAATLHDRLTSYDIKDPALILILREAVTYVIESLQQLEQVLATKALEHRWTLKLGRTHGQFAEPTTFGIELNEYRDAVARCCRRLEHDLRHELNVGKMSGTVGAYVSGDPEFEKLTLGIVGLLPGVATQILARDRHATVLADLASTAFTVSRIAHSLWVLMRSDVNEIEEPKKSKKKRGSSAMPHKTNNPIKTEQLMGLPRLVLGDVTAAFLNIVTFEGRDISQSSVERHIFARATSLVEYMANIMCWLIGNLVVKADVMEHRLLRLSLGVWAGHRLKNELVAAGVDPNVAYTYVQHTCAEAEKSGEHLSPLLSSRVLSTQDTRTAADVLDGQVLLGLFNPRTYVEIGVKHFFPNNREVTSTS